MCATLRLSVTGADAAHVLFDELATGHGDLDGVGDAEDAGHERGSGGHRNERRDTARAVSLLR